MEQGFIKLNRKILDWEWYSDSKTFKVFTHLLLRVNWEEKSWRGTKVLPGQLVTSYGHLAEELSYSVKSIRTAIDKLKSTGELAVQTTNRYSLISIVKWADYQLREETGASKKAIKESSEGQPKGNLRATTKEDKEVKELKEEKNMSKDIVKPPYGNESINELIKYLEESIKGSLDGTQQENRRYAYLLLARFKKDYPTRNEVELVKYLISRGLEDRFHAKNITNFKYLYYNAMKIIQSVKADVNKNTITKIS